MMWKVSLMEPLKQVREIEASALSRWQQLAAAVDADPTALACESGIGPRLTPAVNSAPQKSAAASRSAAFCRSFRSWLNLRPLPERGDSCRDRWRLTGMFHAQR